MDVNNDLSIDASQETSLSLRDLERSLAILSDEHREILLLIGLEQLTYKETAMVLSIPLGTDMSRLARARENLHKIMTGKSAQRIRRVK